MTAPAAAAPGLAPAPPPRREIPRQDDDYTAAAARRRLAFLRETTGAAPEHLGRYSFDPAVLDGNIENFIGVTADYESVPDLDVFAAGIGRGLAQLGQAS